MRRDESILTKNPCHRVKLTIPDGLKTDRKRPKTVAFKESVIISERTIKNIIICGRKVTTTFMV